MNKEHLLKFIVEAHKAGYAAGEAASEIKEKDGSTTVTYKKGSWKYHDNYFGSEPFGGREVIFYGNKPVWMMVYYGSVDKSIGDFERIYTFLQKSLKLAPKDNPYRGPREFEEAEFKYQNTWQGGIESFSGEEIIYQNEKGVYEATYIGGFVDVRKE
ncbi:MAG: hypothetical protein A2113_01020 [Candidatus Woykebacteria bacterium GWA1_44_8]|uniref:DUF5680 domain-containing protein n=1 Tax=Candidatus Woykebacteria bacterium GWA1_44_8 TaxID=1802591 RepID=A0A1G1W2K5_9BACT|nr:MAG: hypothetical protein A2113_01020 [Candidatus Woykebacteria bacterium GWA1_44_8]